MKPGAGERRAGAMGMNRDAMAFVLVAGLASFAGPSFAGASGGPRPQVAVAEPAADAGRVHRGDAVRHDFELRNAGTAPLRVIDAMPACACEAVTFDRLIAPGATGLVHVTLDTSAFTGPIAKGVSVDTDDPDTPRIELILHAQVQPWIAVAPGFARFTAVHGMPAAESFEATLTAPDGQPFEITSVDASFPWLVASFHASDSRPGTWLVDVRLGTDAPVGPISGYVVVQTTHPRQARVEIPVSGFVKPPPH